MGFLEIFISDLVRLGGSTQLGQPGQDGGRFVGRGQDTDGGFAVVDVDTLWRHRSDGRDQHWLGRACKLYTRLGGGEWKMIAHTGLLKYE